MSHRVFHITGPPGTGKTTTLSKNARGAVLARGPKAVTIASMTKAAASEIRSRDVPIERSHVGTLHSLCFHALGAPELTVGRVAEWNAWAAKHELPWCRLSMGKGESVDDPFGEPGAGETMGDQCHAQMEVYRHQLLPESQWLFPAGVLEFARYWRKWMAEAGLTDFTGLLEQATLEVERAPDAPSVLLGDEVQDWSKLEVGLFRDRWGQHAETVLLCGDPDQSIFAWRGANPRIFLDDPVPPENDRVLAQSYRVPRAVHALAQRVVRQIPATERVDVAYEPRDAEGTVDRSSSTWRTPERLLPLLKPQRRGDPR